MEGDEGSDFPPMARLIMPPTMSDVFVLMARAWPLIACARASAEFDEEGEGELGGTLGVLEPESGPGVGDREAVPGVECAM